MKDTNSSLAPQERFTFEATKTTPLPREGHGGGVSMGKVPFLILITNDDGYEAAGIQALVKAVSHLGEVWMVAPDGARSGAAASITCTKPVSYREVGERVFACSGKPVDCVKLALERIVPRKPDLLLSGINHGDNASISVHYSGTMGAVLEGCMKGIPSIGFSLYLWRGQRYEEHPLGQDTLDEIGRFCARVLQNGLPQDVCLNVNFPTDQPFRGWQVCRQARGLWSAEWEPADAPNHYHLTGEFTDLEPDATDTDFAALRAGFCSVVPVTVDTTAHEVIVLLNERLKVNG